MKILLEQKDISVNAGDKDAVTPSHIVLEKGYTKRVKLLLEHKNTTVNTQEKDEKTPLLFSS